jgi:AIR synthase-related protein
VIAASLADLCATVRASLGFEHKHDIAQAFRALGSASAAARNGDDCAAIPDGDGFALFAIEGLLDAFVRSEPWFAGYCGVMVNLSDVAAMGGRATAVVDALWANGDDAAREIFAGMRAASEAYGVPIVGGHTNLRSAEARLAVAVLGRAKRLLTSFGAREGDALLAAIDLRGAFYEPYAYWNCSTSAPAQRLRGDLEILPQLGEAGLCRAVKDISMGGILGTALMMLECSQLGATIDLDAIPKPEAAPIERWLASFPSFGYLIAAPPEQITEITARFTAREIACARIGTCEAGSRVMLDHAGERELLWSFEDAAFIGVHGGR